MTIDRIVLAFAGTVVLLGLLLGVLVNSWWLLLAAFVGLNLLQSAFTGFCPAAMAFRAACAYCCTIRGISPVSSARGVGIGSNPFAVKACPFGWIAEGATGAMPPG